MSQYWFEITPVAKPRQTRSDKWKKRPAVVAYRAFADHIRLLAKKKKLTLPTHGADIYFYLPMPQSWSEAKRRKMANEPHQQKPDLDNLVKAVFDALCEDDCHIWEIRASKRWASAHHPKSGVINILTLGV